MISVNIATHKARAPYLQMVVDALLNQKTKADVISIYFNDCPVPEWVKEKKYSDIVNPIIGGRNLGASGKFYNSETQYRGVYITLDDDLIPDPGYIGYLADSAMRYPDSIVGLHGTIYRRHPIKSYYSDKTKKVLYCYNGNTRDQAVDMLGTGALAFLATNPNKPILSDFVAKNSTDPYLCKKAKENGIPMICLVRSEGFVKEISSAQDTAIWKGVQKDDSKQTEVINSIKNFRRLNAKPINTAKYADGAIEWGHIKTIAAHISRDSRVVEFGSGISTEYLSKFTDSLISFEHNKDWNNSLNIIRSIKNGWYDLNSDDIENIKDADILIVDGPIGSKGDRYNLPLSLLPKDAIIFVDDVNREKDMFQAEEIAGYLKKEIVILKGVQKDMAIIQ